MGSDDLVVLAKRFVGLTAELDATRDAMRRLLMNGAGGEAAPRPTQAGRPGDEAPPSAKMIAAAASEARIIEVLKEHPGMGVSALAEATAAKRSTTAERLRRLRAKGLVEAAEGGGWSAAAA
jgi:hypothetical protein